MGVVAPGEKNIYRT